jgi:hypothetical protein
MKTVVFTLKEGREETAPHCRFKRIEIIPGINIQSTLVGQPYSYNFCFIDGVFDTFYEEIIEDASVDPEDDANYLITYEEAQFIPS